MNNKSQSLTKIALQKFKKDRWGVFSLAFIGLLILMAIFAYMLAPDTSKNANQMHLSIHSKPHGFKVLMLTIPIENKAENGSFFNCFTGFESAATEVPILNYTTDNQTVIYTEYSEDPALAQQKQVPLSVFQTNGSNKKIENYITEKKFYLGTDKYGRDVLSRLLIGSRVSIAIGFIGVFISLLIGIPIGAISGFYGGKVDAFFMWLINIVWSIPTVLLVIAITLALGKGFWQVFVAVGLTMWVEVARVVRGQVMSVKEMQYVTAAKALGYSNFRIVTHHVLPNVLSPVFVISAANFASAILIESGLSFLGLGAQPPVPSWGGMIKDHYHYIILGKAYLAVIPGFAMLLLVLAVMLVGNSLRDALDVK